MKHKKQMNTNALRLLAQQKIPFQLYTTHAENGYLCAKEVAEQLGCQAAQVFKTLVVVGKQTGLLVAVIPGDKALDLKKLAKVSGNKKVDMLPVTELEAATGYIRGGCSPIGMKKQLPTYVAQEAVSQEKMLISAGKRGLHVALAPQALVPLIHARYADITFIK